MRVVDPHHLDGQLQHARIILYLASGPKVSAEHQQRVQLQLTILMVIVGLALQAKVLFRDVEVGLVDEHLLDALCQNLVLLLGGAIDESLVNCKHEAGVGPQESGFVFDLPLQDGDFLTLEALLLFVVGGDLDDFVLHNNNGHRNSILQ